MSMNINNYFKALEANAKSLNKISQKINDIENKLKKIKLNLEFKYKVPDSRYSLLWQQDINSGKFRLMIDCQAIGFPKPLIETNIETRSICVKYLEEFLNKFMEYTSSKIKDLDL